MHEDIDLSIFKGRWEPMASGQLYSSGQNTAMAADEKKDAMVSILESEGPEIHALANQEYSNFSVVLDSGAADHVVDITQTPGYQLQESAGSKAGSCFIAANGDRIPNEGEINLEMRSGNIPLKSTFQVSKISKPLWSVGKLCDAGFKVEFGKSAAIVTHEKTGTKIGEFKRNQGLYVGSLQLRNPTFPRHA